MVCYNYMQLMLSTYKKYLALYKRHERKIIPGMLVLGFLVDVVTFRSIEIRATFIILFIHLVLLAGAIGYILVYDYALSEHEFKALGYGRLLAPLAMQFSFGALLSAGFIFYSFGGALSVSWPLIVVIVFLMLSNEFFKQSYLRPMVQCGVYFFVLFTTLSVMLPFLFRSLSPWIFVLSGIISVVVLGLLVYGLTRLVPVLRVFWKRFGVVVGVLFVFLNGLYFLDIVPPIPVSLREAGVYHQVVRTVEGYEVMQESQSWWQKIVPGQTIHSTSDGQIYIFTAVFAPRDLRVPVVHHWQYYDRAEGGWVTDRKFSFGISGGRAEGYRGFSVHARVREGKWRVLVETERGQVIGRVDFRVVRVPEGVEVERVVR